MLNKKNRYQSSNRNYRVAGWFPPLGVSALTADPEIHRRRYQAKSGEIYGTYYETAGEIHYGKLEGKLPTMSVGGFATC